MRPSRFDGIARTLSAGTSRRHAFLALVAGLFAPVHLDRLASSARRRAKSRNNHEKRGGAKRRRRSHQAGGQRLADAAAGSGGCCKGSGCTPGRNKNLAGCCFDGRNLTGQDFSRSNLKGASFHGTSLANASFAQANLNNACLVDADVTGAAFAGANLSGAIRCRTRTGSGGLDNTGCAKGTICCPTCDAQHPCGADQTCCEGRCTTGACCDNGVQSTCSSGNVCCANHCRAGVCCTAAQCPARTCQARTCQDHACTYAPIGGGSGPNCRPPRICCQDALGEPVCCGDGVQACHPDGRCGCGQDTDCGVNERCCAGLCLARSICCEGGNPAGCAGSFRCCTTAGSGACHECCDDADCLTGQTCQSGACQGVSATFERVRSVVALLFGVDEATIAMDTDLVRDLGADSLDLVELILALEEEFDFTIADEELEGRDIHSVGDVVRAIEDFAM